MIPIKMELVLLLEVHMDLAPHQIQEPLRLNFIWGAIRKLGILVFKLSIEIEIALVIQLFQGFFGALQLIINYFWKVRSHLYKGH